MKWTCSTVRRRLSEYHDGELTIDRRVAIQEHLRACVACAAEARALMVVGSGLRAAAAQRAYSDDSHDLDGLAAGVISRLRVERQESFSHTVERMFEDLHLVWAALGATAATFACLLITVGIFYFSRAEHPESLAAMIDTVRLNGSATQPQMAQQAQLVLPRQEVPPPGAAQPVSDEDVMLDTLITRDGRVDMASLQLMNPDGPTGREDQRDWKAVGDVLDSMAQARFAPARVDGEPVAVKMFWYLTHTTVIADDRAPVRPKARGQVRQASGLSTHTV